MEDCDRIGLQMLKAIVKNHQQFRMLSSVKTIGSENVELRQRQRRARILSVIGSRSFAIALAVLSVIMELGCCAEAAAGGQQPTSSPNEFQIQGQAGSLVRLPCLIGKRVHCGEPYFIAWYKLNATDRQWTRVEALSPADQTTGSDESVSDSGPGRPARAQVELSSASPNRPLADRVQFVWSPTSQLGSNCWPGFDETAAGGNQTNQRTQQLISLRHRQSPSSAQQSSSSSSSSPLALFSALQLFDCAQLTIRPLEAQDEGQYKCEITFSESVEFDRCPVSTTSQLNVIVRPNEPEILLNGRPAANLAAAGNGPTFKEGAQVRLECRSAGGRPAPRIEWLNLTTWIGTTSEPFGSGGGGQKAGVGGNWMEFNDDDDQSMSRAQQQPELAQLMRLHWPIKRATYLANSYDSIASATQQQQQQLNNNIDQVALNQQQLIPVTSSSIMITLSRFDLRSRFACLVLPQTATTVAAAPTQNPLPDNGNNQASLAELPAALRSAHALNQAADQVPMLVNARPHLSEGLMLKWVKLNVLAKPKSVSIRVLELNRPDQQLQVDSTNQQVKLVQQTNSGRQSFYSLRPNRLYAIQCLVENSRPRSQVAWFNASAPLELDEPAVELKSTDYDLLTRANSRPGQQHRLTSFVRHIEQEPAGTFRTISTLLLTTTFDDNFQELSCRVSNEAFQFEELVQVAPVVSARIYVNYPPTSWLEAPNVDWKTTTTTTAQSELQAVHAKLGRLGAELGQRVLFRCFVGANPLLQNAIVQIDWLKDGRRLTSANGTLSRLSRVQIERANHLHMPMLGASQQTGELSPESTHLGGLATSARLLTASTLTIHTLADSDAGLYSCQFKLIPAPSTSSAASLQQVAAAATQANVSSLQFQFQFPQAANVAPANRIVSGQSSQAIQLTVIEAKLPVLRLASPTGLLVYEHAAAKDGQPQKSGRDNQQQRRPPAEILVANANSELSFKCDHSAQPQTDHPLGRRYLWYFDGALVHSSPRDLLVLRPQVDDYAVDELTGLRAKLLKGNGARLSCAQEMLEPGSLLTAPGNFHAKSMKLFPSTNEIQLRFKAGPKLLQDTKLDLMPAQRSFSEFELSSQPLNRLKLVCLALCEPICSIDWLINKRQLTSAISYMHQDQDLAGGNSDDEFHIQPTQEVADNQPARLFKSFRRLEGSLMDSMRPEPGGNQAAGQFSLVQVDNLIRRESASSSGFIWFRQTSLGPIQNQQLELVSRQLARDSQELQVTVQTPWNVMSKFELSYSQINRLLQAARPDEQLLVECKLDETLGGRQGFGWALIKAGAFYPYSKLETPPIKLLTKSHEPPANESDHEQQDEQLAALFNSDQLDLKTLFDNSKRRDDLNSSNTSQTRIILKASQAMVLRPTLAPPGGELAMQTLIAPSPSSVPANNSPRALSANEPVNNASNNHLQPPPQTSQRPDSPESGNSLSPLVRGWLAGHQQLVLVGSCVLAVLWLTALLAAPLMRRRLFRSPKLALFSPGPGANQRNRTATNWRFNDKLCSRTSSTNEIGPFGTVNGTGGGGGSLTSSTIMHQNHHKFSMLQQQQPLSSLGAATVANYYGAPESNGADSSEHDMVQSCSQSSNYEDFIQHQQQQQQRLHHQPLYFNQAQLVESTTLSRRPLVQQCSASSNSATNCHKQRNNIQQHAPATMRHNLSNVPLISGLNQQTSSTRINFSDLQRHSRALANERYAMGVEANNSHHYSFGKIPAGGKQKRRANSNNQNQEHIYDDVG